MASSNEMEKPTFNSRSNKEARLKKTIAYTVSLKNRELTVWCLRALVVVH